MSPMAYEIEETPIRIEELEVGPFYSDDHTVPMDLNLDTPSLDNPKLTDGPLWPQLETDLMFSNVFDCAPKVNCEFEFSDNFDVVEPKDEFLGDLPIDLNFLDAQDIDEILHETSPEVDTTELIRAVSHDHDYCDQDWKILSEFMDFDFTQPQKTDCPLFGESDATGALESFPTFMDTNIDLTPLIQESSTKPAPGPIKDNKYYQRRQKNNVACQRSRQTAKERRLAMKEEQEFLEYENANLNVQISNLEALRDEWKTKLMHLIGKK